MRRINIENSGNWSDTNIWPGGVLPTTEDKVFANGNYVTIDTNVDVKLLTNERTYADVHGGKFTVNDGITIKANMYSGSEPLITFSDTGSIIIIGNIEGSRESEACCIENTGTGTIHISGNVRGGWGGFVPAIKNIWTGTIDLTGNATMGLGGGSFAITNHQEGQIIINGEVNTDNKSYGTEPYTGEGFIE
jgi:hypothetical protein